MAASLAEGKKSGSGWESNPPGLLLQHPSDGFEDRGAHQDSTTPKQDTRIPNFGGFVKCRQACNERTLPEPLTISVS